MTVVLWPDLPVVDAHHHLWVRDGKEYLTEEFAADLATGHNVVATVYVECGSRYRTDGPEHLRCVGEAEFVASVADRRICAAFVGAVDLRLGTAVDEVLDALAEASGGRLRGIRGAVASDPDPAINPGGRLAPPGLLLDGAFRAGVARLAARGLVYDAWQYHPQLPELLSLVDAFPQLTVVVNHCAGPLGAGNYRRADVFPDWRALVAELAKRPNVVMKLGGMSRKRCGFDFEDWPTPPTAEQLAHAWRPYMETCIELFGADRCMYESNFPPDNVAGSYRTLWNALKLTASRCSDSERAALFSETARRVYRITPP